MNLDARTLEILAQAASNLGSGFSQLPDSGSDKASDLEAVLRTVAAKLHDNYPYHHPLYLGQMLKPPHPVAHLAYTLAMCINPNNHAHDGGRASSEMEKDAVHQIAKMFGWDSALGHLCGGGTVANLEALWVGREVTDGQLVIASNQAHYTHQRCCEVLNAPFQSVLCDQSGRMDIKALKKILNDQPVGTVVATLGTTGLGAADPFDEILALRDEFGFRVHVDAAYGGYFKLATNLPSHTLRQFELFSEADSIVVDPHKHGLQPYGCGCVLFKDPSVARVYKHDSPYTYFTSDELHLGEISLECSRPGAAAAALWATLQRFPLQNHGEFSQRLESSRHAAEILSKWIQRQEHFNLVVEPELDIVVWSIQANSARRASTLAQQFFNVAAENDLHLALLKVPRRIAETSCENSNWDQDHVVCLRACLMKPEHETWMPRIIEKLEAVSSTVFKKS